MISDRGRKLIQHSVETGEAFEEHLTDYVGALENACAAMMLGHAQRKAIALVALREVEQDCDIYFSATSVYRGEDGG